MSDTHTQGVVHVAIGYIRQGNKESQTICSGKGDFDGLDGDRTDFLEKFTP